MLKGSLVGVALSTIMIGICIVPVMGQGVTTGYTVHVDFVYPFCWLYNVQVSFSDQTGRVIGTGVSLDGSELIIPLRVETPTLTLTARAVGYASLGSGYYWPLRVISPVYPGSDYYWQITGASTIIVQNTSGDYWITLVMAKS